MLILRISAEIWNASHKIPLGFVLSLVSFSISFRLGEMHFVLHWYAFSLLRLCLWAGKISARWDLVVGSLWGPRSHTRTAHVSYNSKAGIQFVLYLRLKPLDSGTHHLLLMTSITCPDMRSLDSLSGHCVPTEPSVSLHYPAVSKLFFFSCSLHHRGSSPSTSSCPTAPLQLHPLCSVTRSMNLLPRLLSFTAVQRFNKKLFFLF